MSEEPELPAPLYEHPKVMLIDVPDAAAATVRAAGYSVTRGSLGRVLATKPRPGFLPVPMNGQLSGFMEQEVVVVQMSASEPIELRPEDVPVATANTRIWVNLESGQFDPRPVLARNAAKYSERILTHGGVFIVFVASETDAHLIRGTGQPYGGNVYVDGDLEWSVYDLVSELAGFNFSFDNGVDIRPEKFDAFDVLAPFLREALFTCDIREPSGYKRFLPLAKSKYGKVVAGVLRTESVELHDGTESHGWVFLLPQVADIGGCVTALLDTLLPRFAPRIFPETKQTVWLEEDEYELPAVVTLKARIAEIRAEAERRESQLREAIEDERRKDGWMHALLTESDSNLVDAVVIALGELGLTDVRKVDDEEEQRERGRRREDIQVWGQSPILLVEVKGIYALPREHHALQVWKYLVPRMRQWKRNDIRGLAVINQQRGLPGLGRENLQTFQQDVLDNAGEQGFGLVTTVDLFRLVRNKRRWGWPDETVTPLFEQNGRIEPLPTHYEEVGVIDGFFEKAGVVAISVTNEGFSVGDELAFRLPIEYLEQIVESIHVDDESVQRAASDQRVGIRTELTRAQARNGVLVYRLKPPD